MTPPPVVRLAAVASLALLGYAPLLSFLQPAEVGWFVVTSVTPLLRNAENGTDAVVGVLRPGALVTRLAAPPAARDLTFDQVFLGMGRLQGNGAVIPVRVHSGTQKQLMFANTLQRAALQASRGALCDAILQRRDIVVSKSACEDVATFYALGTSSRIAAVLQPEPEKGWLVVLDGSTTPRPLSVTSVVGFDYRGWHRLSDVESVILGEQFVRRGSLTGFELTPLVVNVQGAISEGPRVAFKTANPIGGVSTVVQGDYRVSSEKNLTVSFSLAEEVREIRSGTRKSRVDRSVTLVWNPAKHAFDVTEFLGK